METRFFKLPVELFWEVEREEVISPQLLLQLEFIIAYGIGMRFSRRREPMETHPMMPSADARLHWYPPMGGTNGDAHNSIFL